MSTNTNFTNRSNATTNRAGAPAYLRSLQEQVVQILTLGTLTDTFYASAKGLTEEAVAVCLEARKACPHFLARALVYARESGYVKAAPTLGLAILSGGGAETKSLFASAFGRVVRTPDDLRRFVGLCREGRGRKGFGGIARDCAASWIAGLSEYHAVKYGSARSDGFTLRDLVRLSHPKPADAATSERISWLLRGSEGLGSDVAANPAIRAFEALKRATDPNEQAELVRQGKLPFEAVVPALGAKNDAAWVALLGNAPYGNLLSSIVAFGRRGVWADEANVRSAVERLTNDRARAKARVSPHQLWQALERIRQEASVADAIVSAVAEALERSVDDGEPLPGRVAIGVDVSGSMGASLSGGSTRLVDIASVFAVALARRAAEPLVLPVDLSVYAEEGREILKLPLARAATKLASFGGGGTSLGAPVELLLQKRERVDWYVGITDNEDWAYGESHRTKRSFLSAWRVYRQHVNPNARAMLLTLAPTREVVAPAGEPGVTFVYGWSDAVLRLAADRLKGSARSQVEVVERVGL